MMKTITLNYRKAQILTLLSLFLCVGWQAMAQTQTLRVKVRNSQTRAYIANANVEISYNNAVQHVAQTNSRGQAVFRIPRNTRATIHVSKDGYNVQRPTRGVLMSRNRGRTFNATPVAPPPPVDAPITITPNPVRQGDDVLIDFDNLSQKLEIFDSNNRLVRIADFTNRYGAITEATFKTTYLNPGNYSVKLTQSNGLGIVRSSFSIIPGDPIVNNTRLTVKAVDGNGNPINDAEFSLLIDQEPFTLFTNAAGEASQLFPYGVLVVARVKKAGVIFPDSFQSLYLRGAQTISFRGSPEREKVFSIAPNPINNGSILRVSRRPGQNRGSVSRVKIIDQSARVISDFEWDGYGGNSQGFRVSVGSPGMYFVLLDMSGTWPDEVHQLIVR